MNSFNAKHKQIIRDIMKREDDMNERKVEINESKKALAEELGVKPAEITKIISLVRQEEAQAGSLVFNQELLDMAKELV